MFDIDGNTINFERLLGRYVLVVNVHPADPHWDVQLEWMAAESASTARLALQVYCETFALV